MMAMPAFSRRGLPAFNPLLRVQQRGARVTPPLRRNVPLQPPTQPPRNATRPAPTKPKSHRKPSPTVTAAAAAAAAATKATTAMMAAARGRLSPRYARGGSGAKTTPRSKHLNEPAKANGKHSDEAIAAAERTHSGNSRLGLSRNALVLRFSNENSYLNWARNGVLSSAVGVAMYAQEHHRGAQLSGAGLLLLGFGYIGVGTAKYIYYILRFRQVMELSWASVIGTSSHATAALVIWLTATASFLESVPLELDAMLLTEPIIDYLPFRIRQGLIETYSLYLDDLEHHTDEQERVLRAIRGEQYYEVAKTVATPPRES